MSKINEKKFNTQDSAYGTCLYIVLQFIIIFIYVAIARSSGNSNTLAQIFTILIQFAFAGTVFLIARSKPKFIEATTLNKKPETKQIGIAIAIAVVALFAFTGLTNTFMTFLEKVGYTASSDSFVVDSFPRYLLYTLTICVVPAICEELLFRGLVFQGLRSWNEKGAVVISAFIFMLMHGSPDQTIHQFILGIILAVAFIKAGTIWVPMIIHFANNFIALTIGFIGTRQGWYETTAEVAEKAVEWSDVTGSLLSAVIPAVVGVLLLWWLFKLLKEYRKPQRNTAVLLSNNENVEVIVQDVVTEESASINEVPVEMKTTKSKFSVQSIVLFAVAGAWLIYEWIGALIAGL